VVDVSFMSLERGLDLEVSAPDFESSIPTNGGEVWLEGSLFALDFDQWRVSNTANPILMVVLFTGIFAISQSVPEFDFSISSRAKDLSVIWTEGNGENFLSVSGESSGGSSSFQVPQSEGFVPGS